ncbi:MAG: MBL fold metallo-hydrolase [Aestuariivita sp.]|nr:MBL fold metallo-hydrolase [Aestuariivita sp.]MCY4345638.1 MBL fold metallo-hydrolase [Aestuariivita sp.]
MGLNLLEPRPEDYGVQIQISPQLRRILAPNPSPMTNLGTNTYLIGSSDIAVIDPGPASDVHLNSILQALEPGQFISHIFISHTHLDHSALARSLSEKTGAPIVGFGSYLEGRSAVMTQLAKAGLVGGGEGTDSDFTPDRQIRHGERICGSTWELEVIHTPGHTGNHIALAWGDDCFTADHVMDWSTSLISPPDGDLTDFMESCHQLLQRNWKYFFPGHGAPVLHPVERLNWLIAHRNNRENAILDALHLNPLTPSELAAQVYVDTPKDLRPAAMRNVFAHLIHLYGKSQVLIEGKLSINATFRLSKSSDSAKSSGKA